MGRIYLTARVIVIDEVPSDARSPVAYFDRGWCFFECVVASMNTFPRDLMWVDKSIKDEIARFRELSSDFRETGELAKLLETFDAEMSGKAFASAEDRELVRGFLVSLAKSQRLITAASRGDTRGVLKALDDGGDVRCRNGQGLTALHAAALNGRVAATAALLRCAPTSVNVRTMDNETPLQLAEQAAARECQVLIRHW